MPKNEQPNFENAIARLDAIVGEMESDTLSLEDLIARYEEGLKLVKYCSEKLDSAEKRIEIITREAGGKPKLVEFEPAVRQAVEPGAEQVPAPDVRLF